MTLYLWIATVVVLTFGCKNTFETEEIDVREGEPYAEAEPANTSAYISAAPNPTVSNVAGRNQPIGILYFLWHCAAVESPRNVTDILNSLNVAPGSPQATQAINQNVNRFPPGFMWWDWPSFDGPANRPYCLSNNDALLRRHAVLLRNAGINFIVLDVSNHANVGELDAERMILKPLRALLRVWSTINGAPKVVPWVPFQDHNPDGPNNANPRHKGTLAYITELMARDYPDMLYRYGNKVLLGEVYDTDRYKDIAQQQANRQAYAASWRVFKMWGNRDISDEQNFKWHWSFLSNCRNAAALRTNAGIGVCNQPANAEMVPIATATEGSHTKPQTNQKFHGRTFINQFQTAFERPNHKFIMITGWNEWIAGPHRVGNRLEFIDAFDFQRNRDIEPSRSEGTYYYFLMKHLISDYRAGKKFSRHAYYMDYVGLFDQAFYAQNNPQLVQILGNNWTALYNHWRTYGINEGRVASRAFDVNVYK